MKYPPTIALGSPVSACQRNGSVKVSIGSGTTSTAADAGSRSDANTADQPGGGGSAAAAGNGRGTIGNTASTAQDMTSTDGHRPAAAAATAGPRRRRSPARWAGGQSLPARQRPRLYSRVGGQGEQDGGCSVRQQGNRSGRAELSSGRPCSQYRAA